MIPETIVISPKMNETLGKEKAPSGNDQTGSGFLAPGLNTSGLVRDPRAPPLTRAKGFRRNDPGHFS